MRWRCATRGAKEEERKNKLIASFATIEFPGTGTKRGVEYFTRT